MTTTVRAETGQPTSVRWSRAEYDRMMAVGLLGDGGYELRDGVVFLAGRPKVWGREEYYRLGALGLFEDRRVELINGEILMSPNPGPEHASARRRLRRALEARLPAGHCLIDQDALSIAGRAANDPAPDLAVVPGTLEDYDHAHPTAALLVVEISQRTLAYDLAEKAALYADARIPHYWVLDLAGRRLLAHADPADGRYAAPTSHVEGETIPVPWDAATSIAIATLLPPA